MRRGFAALALAISTWGLQAWVPAGATATSCTWHAVAMPPGLRGALTDVAGFGATDRWAVGDTGSYPQSPLVLHDDGSGWATVSTPVDDRVGSLHAISSLGPDDLWAVGGSYGPPGTRRSFILHFDGTGWTRYAAPRTRRDQFLNDLLAVGPKDVWAVGLVYRSTAGGTFGRSLILHWDGGSWSRSPAPQVSTSTPPYEVLDAIATDGTSLWAVGFMDTGGYNAVPLVERWRAGTGWANVTGLPAGGGTGDTILTDVAASPGAVMVIGTSEASTPAGTDFPYAARLHHRVWTETAVPAPTGAFLWGLVRASSSDITAVGWTFDATTSVADPFIAHWNGKTWNAFHVGATASNSRLRAISADPSGELVAVGETYDGTAEPPTITPFVMTSC